MVIIRPHLSGDKARKVPVDPAAHHHHGYHAGHVPLQHVRHHARVGHGVGRGCRLLAPHLVKKSLFATRSLSPTVKVETVPGNDTHMSILLFKKNLV